MNSKQILKNISILPYFIIFFVDLAVYILLFLYFASSEFQMTKVWYGLLVLVVAALIYILRIKIVGKETVFDRFTKEKNVGSAIVAFVSLCLSIILVTTLIVKLPWAAFINDFQAVSYSPLYWFEFLGKNYLTISIYASIIFIISYIIFIPTFFMKEMTSRFGKSLRAQTFGLIAVIIILPLLASRTFQSFIQSLVEMKLLSLALGVLFGGSAIYFNLFFLLRKPKNQNSDLLK